MPSPSKRKGNNFERLVVNTAKKAGFPSKRAWGSDGRSIGEHETVDCLVGGFKIQCKSRKHIANWLKVPEHCDVTCVKENHGKIYAIMEYDDWLDLLSMLN